MLKGTLGKAIGDGVRRGQGQVTALRESERIERLGITACGGQIGVASSAGVAATALRSRADGGAGWWEVPRVNTQWFKDSFDAQ